MILAFILVMLLGLELQNTVVYEHVEDCVAAVDVLNKSMDVNGVQVFACYDVKNKQFVYANRNKPETDLHQGPEEEFK